MTLNKEVVDMLTMSFHISRMLLLLLLLFSSYFAGDNHVRPCSRKKGELMSYSNLRVLSDSDLRQAN